MFVGLLTLLIHYKVIRKIETNNNNFYKFSAARSLPEYNQLKITFSFR